MFTSSQARVRAAVYEHLIRHGVAPDASSLAGTLGIDEPDALASLRELADAHALALGSDRESIWMAHPFSAVPTLYPVETTDGAQYRANCAWDALGVLALLGCDGRSVTKCPDCNDPMVLEVVDGALVPSDDVVHFLVPPRRFWDDVGFT